MDKVTSHYIAEGLAGGAIPSLGTTIVGTAQCAVQKTNAGQNGVLSLRKNETQDRTVFCPYEKTKRRTERCSVPTKKQTQDRTVFCPYMKYIKGGR